MHKLEKEKRVSKLKFFTKKDYENLNPYQLMKLDNRSFLELYKNFLLDDHLIYNLFYFDSVLEPIWFRIMIFITEINVNFAMSALFFSDDYIDSRLNIPKRVRVNLYL